ncbi:MAG TPA: lytic transglycosylase domain-containing protein [Noviherbaspirillum sp.]|uniref:lytic transglycosylase domain-containing protein n=1 Tax=Noviherbaspirillum sp. TaxID=1926288 RepID=UPI002D508B7F|nr:lytic transglycosylase domain-containing protein [Noviherbaspirillum sp.]HYD96972.1 lytic transglycosylase domain-containing protein [Noviherbaspirillum sp.]
MMLYAAAAHAQETRIYRSYDASGRPTFSDRPLNRSSQLYASFDGTYLWPRAGTGPVSLPQLSARRSALEPLLQRAAAAHGIQPALLKAIIEVESGFNAQARSPKGAVGLMQVMPATAARYGRFDLYSPEQNLDVGARYLRDLLALFNGNVRLAVAAYNAGENAVIRHGRQIPPYAETIKYVPMVMERYSRFQSQATH